MALLITCFQTLTCKPESEEEEDTKFNEGGRQGRRLVLPGISCLKNFLFISLEGDAFFMQEMAENIKHVKVLTIRSHVIWREMVEQRMNFFKINFLAWRLPGIGVG